MKQKLILLFSVLVLITVLFFMSKDLFIEPKKSSDNPYEYNIDQLKKIDTALFCYSENGIIKPEAEKIVGIFIDEEDNIYISGSGKIFIYTKDLQLTNTLVVSNDARCMAMALDGNLLLGIVDHVEKWSLEGKLIHNCNPFDDKTLITSIAVSDSSVFVADVGNKIVYHCNGLGEIINEIGRKDTLKGIPGFIIPSPYFDLAIGRDDEIWVVNPGRHAFESYDKKGNLKSRWEKTSMQIDGFSGCCNPGNIAILSDGSFVTSEKGLVRVKIHAPDGSLKCVVAGPDSFDDATKWLDLAVDSNDNIYVLDPIKGEVKRYERKK